MQPGSTSRDFTIDQPRQRSHIQGMIHDVIMPNAVLLSKILWWTCQMCNTTMTSKLQEAHLVGFTHQAGIKRFKAYKSLVIGDLGEEMRTTLNLPPVESTKEPLELLWTCKICNISGSETGVGSAGSERAHREGKRHQATLRNGPQEFLLAVAQEQNPTWACPTCDITMAAEFEESHTRGKAHQQKLGLEQPKQPKERINTTLSKKEKTFSKMEKVWKCTTCNSTMAQSAQSSHERGKRHRASLGDPTSGPSYPGKRDTTESIAEREARKTLQKRRIADSRKRKHPAWLGRGYNSSILNMTIGQRAMRREANITARQWKLYLVWKKKQQKQVKKQPKEEKAQPMVRQRRSGQPKAQQRKEIEEWRQRKIQAKKEKVHGPREVCRRTYLVWKKFTDLYGRF